MSADLKRQTVTITVELEPNEAAALARLCEKFHWEDANQYLYAHVSRDIRDAQSYQMVHALAEVAKALLAAEVRGWPWVETGSAE